MAMFCILKLTKKLKIKKKSKTLKNIKMKMFAGFSPGSASGVSAGNVSNNSSNRRKSVGHIPLSPLARTPSPSPLPASPTRSPSPLAFPVIVHQPGEFH